MIQIYGGTVINGYGAVTDLTNEDLDDDGFSNLTTVNIAIQCLMPENDGGASLMFLTCLAADVFVLMIFKLISLSKMNNKLVHQIDDVESTLEAEKKFRMDPERAMSAKVEN